MTGRLEGKSAIVTGGSRGIGAAIAERLAAEGAAVAITYTARPDAAQEVVGRIEGAGGRAFAVQADAADPENGAATLGQAAERLGGLDILVHNAGIGRFAPIDDASFDEFRQQFSVNVDGVYAGTRAVLPQLRDGGRIIVIGSINAHTMPFPGGAIYGATKAAVAGLIRGWARDLGGRRILVNAIQPGPIDTDLNPGTGEFAESLIKLTALGRYGRVEEVAALTAFLASDEASYITGTTIDIDGGMTI
jgi:3-oxoacyl-[acyl-carrier protein] reductase